MDLVGVFSRWKNLEFCTTRTAGHSKPRLVTQPVGRDQMQFSYLLGERKMAEIIAEKLAVEEFRQLHEHMRQHETAMGQMLTVSTTGATTLLVATAAFVFQSLENKSLVYCYILLLPIPFIIFMLDIITAHRFGIYRMGYYITVFYEEKYGGAEWGIRSFRFRELQKGESQDAVTLVFWSLFVMSSALFVTSVSLHGTMVFLNTLILIPLALWMAHQHRKFHQDLRPIKRVRLDVLREQEVAVNKPAGPTESALQKS